MSNPINAAALLARGLKTDFMTVYDDAVARTNKKLGLLMDLNKQSDGAYEDYVHPQDVGRFKRKPKHEAVPTSSYRYLSWRTVNHTWADAAEWHSEDQDDDQTKMLPDQVRGMGKAAGEVPDRIHWQLRLGSANHDLLPAIPL